MPTDVAQDQAQGLRDLVGEGRQAVAELAGFGAGQGAEGFGKHPVRDVRHRVTAGDQELASARRL